MDDPAQLGFTFAKEVATQLITLSTGVLALSATFTKDILKTIPAGKERLLHVAWGVHVLAIIFGVWSLLGITGTLLPLDGVRQAPLQLGANARLPALGQILMFLLGTGLLVAVHGAKAPKIPAEEFKIAEFADAEAASSGLGLLKCEGWDVIAFSVVQNMRVVVLLKRSKVFDKVGGAPSAASL